MKPNIISNNLSKSLPLLRVVTRLPPNSRKRILKELSNEKIVYKALNELAQNTLSGKIPLSNGQRRRLKSHKKTLENFCNAKKCNKKRKQLIIQSGGFLPIVLQALIPILDSLVASKLSQ